MNRHFIDIPAGLSQTVTEFIADNPHITLAELLVNGMAVISIHRRMGYSDVKIRGHTYKMLNILKTQTDRLQERNFQLSLFK